MSHDRSSTGRRPHGNLLAPALPKNLRSFVSHELRAPLTCVDGALRLVTSQDVQLAQEQVAELINVARNSAQRLVTLVDRLLGDPSANYVFDQKPRRVEQASSHPLPANTRRQETEELNILMVEDDSDYFRYVRQALQGNRHSNYEVHNVACVEAVNQHVATTAVDVILLDLSLPDSEGLDTVRRVRAICPRTPIVVLTGTSDEELGLEALAEGADDYLVKHHVTHDSLRRCIRYAVTRKTFEESTMRLAAIKDFTHALAHDLTVPLTGARNVLQALSNCGFGPLTAQQEEVVRILARSNEEQLQLVQKLLEVYSYDLMSPDIPFEPVELNSTVDEAISLLGADEDTASRLANELPAQSTKIRGNAQALVRMFFNVIENAVRYSDPDSIIRISAEQTAGSVGVSIHNFGKPVPPQVMAGMFDRFWRGIPGKTYVQRSGVGLYLAQRIASLHGGRIACQSDRQAGTTVTIQLPLSS